MRKTLALLALLLALPVAAQLQVTDDRGVTVSFARSPQRVVSLLPSLTESVCALGECRRLVGVDRFSNFPATVRDLPKVGGGIDPNIEAVVALRPEVVLIATSSRGAQRLESLGVKVLALEPHTSADARRVLERLGQLLEVPDAQRVWREIDAGVAAAAQSLPPSARNLRVYYEVSRGPYAAGPASFLGELLQRLGARNIIDPELGPFPQINPEFVVRADPDVIMAGDSEAQGLAQRPGWAGLRALRSGRVCLFSPDESDVLLRPGPRMPEAARLLARCLAHPSGMKRRG
ncbi:ABC transporter substrate-binding protein [Ramlibacter solisilvae]|uniref:ABC transporter substrate-binding protein n=1 Tax=Ramlibacter tataouinensis TaxID=94132 RepID=A0A127JP53_9BURK|nr:helical backbone metal receptor [Ramlibacter tataouinensis]AMO21735.1 ABC transporter substrate-binding protein [Ramlibacter tataouinensis]